jgi:hypothetical protein
MRIAGTHRSSNSSITNRLREDGWGREEPNQQATEVKIDFAHRVLRAAMEDPPAVMG